MTSSRWVDAWSSSLISCHRSFLGRLLICSGVRFRIAVIGIALRFISLISLFGESIQVPDEPPGYAEHEGSNDEEYGDVHDVLLVWDLRSRPLSLSVQSKT